MCGTELAGKSEEKTMTRSDDTLERDERCETKNPEVRRTGELGVHPPGNEDSKGIDTLRTDNTKDVPTSPNDRKMGSTDSPGSKNSGGSSCGLVSSLFPNSCRGRAESFARRLHRRLTSLGGEGNFTDEDLRSSANKATETSWLHASTGQRTTTNVPTNSATSLSSSLMQNDERVLECQPHHSPESDIYYDFDIDADDHHGSGSTGSPAEMANADDLASILVNPGILKSNHHEACHCSPGGPRPPEFNSPDSESGYVYSSPIAGTSPDTENSEMYFDPESSETDKSRGETFFDPQSTSTESEANVPNGIGTKVCRLPGRRRDCNKPAEDSSESSCSSCNPVTLENDRPPGLPAAGSSEESLNGKSSLETTSPSHESLWSTFDESTVSLQDESPITVGCVSVASQTRLPKSHSDSEITGNQTVTIKADFVQPEVRQDEACLMNGDMDDIESLDKDYTTYSASIDIPGSLVLECPSGRRVTTVEESLKNEVNLRIGSPNAEDMSKLLERLSCSPTIDDKVPEELRNDDKEEISNEDDVEGEEEKDDDADEDENRPQRVRRCSSLKTGKTPPGTPGRKKIVRFADVLGLDLADVRTFLDEIPKIPNSAYSDLIYDEAFQKDSSPVNFWGTGPATFTTPLYAATMPRGPMAGVKLDRTLVPLFQQPGGQPTFLDLVRERQVCLENVVVQDPLTMCLQGTVRVRNLDFHKSVHVRYSLDSWRNFSDLQANYASNSCDGFSDKFTFVLYCHTLKVGQRLELAVRFQCKGSQYWDNNDGVNYCFQCLPATPANPGYIPITAPTVTSGTHSNRDWSPTFY